MLNKINGLKEENLELQRRVKTCETVDLMQAQVTAL
jgi:hypothetical protein